MTYAPSVLINGGTVGFSTELLILYRRALPGTDRAVWEAHETIIFGRVTRIQKLTEPRFDHIVTRPHRRAGICVVSALLGKLFAKLDVSPREAIAPSFLVSEYEDEREAEIKNTSGDVVDPYGFLEGRSFDDSKKELHNKALSLNDADLSRHLERSHPIMKPPFLWERCAVLAEWLQEAESTETIEWRELQKDPVSLALARAWRSYMREVGSVDARALFTFPP